MRVVRYSTYSIDDNFMPVHETRDPEVKTRDVEMSCLKIPLCKAPDVSRLCAIVLSN